MPREGALPSGPSNSSDPKVEGPFFYMGTNEEKSTGHSTAEGLNAFEQAYANGSEAGVAFLAENMNKPGVVNVPNFFRVSTESNLCSLFFTESQVAGDTSQRPVVRSPRGRPRHAPPQGAHPATQVHDLIAARP